MLSSELGLVVAASDLARCSSQNGPSSVWGMQADQSCGGRSHAGPAWRLVPDGHSAGASDAAWSAHIAGIASLALD